MHDALVLGAGLSGLLATRRLRAAGLDVRLLDARDRIGGRVHHADGLDLGASWVWDSERHVHALIRELGVPTFPHPTDGLDLYDGPDGVQSGRLPRSPVPERRIVGGTVRLIEAVAQGLAPTLGTPALGLSVVPGGLRVHTASGPLDARHVIAALPPALLAALDLPDAVPDAQRARWASTGTWMAGVAKVVARYRRPWWRERGLSGRVFSHVGPLTEVHDLSGPEGRPAALFGFVHRPHATGDWQARARDQLVRLFGPEAVPDTWHATAWWNEPATVAAGPQPPPDGLGHPDLRRPALDGRLHLCSTETARGSAGHLDGAVERAEHVAREVVAALTESP